MNEAVNNSRITRLEDGFLDLKLQMDEIKRFQDITHEQYQYNKNNKKTIEDLIKVKDETYRERNLCIAALANFVRDIAAPGYRVYVAEHEGEDWEGDWRTVLVIQKGDIQMTWHFHDSETHLLSRLPRMNSYHWDGHDTKEKYNRLIRCFING